MQKKSAFGANNFDRIANAGGVAGADDSENIKHKLHKRVLDLVALVAQLRKVVTYLDTLNELNKQRRLKRLKNALTGIKTVMDRGLPVGAKRYVSTCCNELQSIKEGVVVQNDELTQSDFVLSACAASIESLSAMIVSATQRHDRALAESTSHIDLDAFWAKTATVIEQTQQEASKLSEIRTKPFVVARVPVVPVGTVRSDVLSRLGFDVKDLGGYPSFQNQLVLGIRPKSLLGEHSGAVKNDKAISVIREEADRLRKAMQREMKVKLQFVSSQSFSHDSGTWFWLMTDSELDKLSLASSQGHVKIQRWGFSF